MVYVDNFEIKFKNMKMYHLLADTEEELHIFAEKIGLKREWFQNKKIKHYDISKSKKELAIKNGAKELSYKEVNYPIAKDNWASCFIVS